MDGSLSNAIFSDPLVEVERKLIADRVDDRLRHLLVDANAAQDYGVLQPFVEDAPWRYWGVTVVERALTLLEEDVGRTVSAIEERSAEISSGLDNLFRRSRVASMERTLDHHKARDLLLVSTDFHPEYLRWAEHAFGNLVRLYWSVAKKGGVAGKFDLRGGTDQLRHRGHASLTDGYSDRVRNAITHGQTVFWGTDISYGQVTRLSASAFMAQFDSLCRTTNALALGLVLFWLRNRGHIHLTRSIPLGLLGRLVAGAIERPGCRFLGVLESKTASGRAQLQSAVSLRSRSREEAMLVAFRVAGHLVGLGVERCERVVVEIDHGAPINSIVMIKFETLRELLKEDAAVERLEEALDGTSLLWFQEPWIRTRLRAWKNIIRAVWRGQRAIAIRDWQAAGLAKGKNRFRIRAMENVSVGGTARMTVLAVLRTPGDGDDKETIRAVLEEIARWARRKRIRARDVVLEGGPSFRKRPSHVFIDLFKEDGTIRWLKSGGWESGNLVAVAERVWGKRAPVFVTNAQEEYHSVRIRYEMDKAAFVAAIANLTRSVTGADGEAS